MKQGFKKLAGLAAGGSLALSGLMAASVARAVTNISAGRVLFSSIGTGPGGGSPARELYVEDASFPGTGPSDAFDGALRIQFPSAAAVDRSTSASSNAFFNLGNATVDNNGPSAVSTVSGNAGLPRLSSSNPLGLAFTYTFDPATESVQLFATVTNNTGQNQAGALRILSNFGSDSDTTIELTSSGDNLIDETDTWAITSDGTDPASGGDAVVRSEVCTDGMTIIQSSSSPDRFYYSIDVDLADGESQELCVTHRIYPSFAEAGLGANAVPAMGNPGIAALAVLTGLFGAAGAMRRRRRQQG